MDLEGWGSAAADLLLGASCAGCRQPWWGVCRECRALVGDRSPYLVQPSPCPPGFPTTVASSPYDPVVRRLISAHKEQQALAVTGFLGGRLALAVHALLASGRLPKNRQVVLVPVPSSARSVRARGFDATLAMTQRAARRLRSRHRVLVRPVLQQRRGVADQAGLDAAARAANLAGALRTRPRTLGGGRGPASLATDRFWVVVVDDVVTTGSSLGEAVRVLESTGVEVAGAATVAATVRRFRPRTDR